MRIHVVIATVGRPETVRKVVEHLGKQSRPADGVIVVGADAKDVDGLDRLEAGPTVLIAPKGSCSQRNAGIDKIQDCSDVVIFFDDDFVPAHDYIEVVESLMSADSSIVGLTGELVDDGARGEAIRFEDAVRRLDLDHERLPEADLRTREALYGCNMAIRMEALGGLRFDENLPLYGWMEDIDLTYQLAKHGRLLSGPAITGIHLGVRGGRSPGKRVGYSQVANIVYLYRKGTMQPNLGWRSLFKNVAANLVKSIRPEPEIDRRGRLLGNMIAVTDLIRGRIDPRRITSF